MYPAERARNPGIRDVSYLPLRNSSLTSTSRCSGIVVAMPSIRADASARSIVSIAFSRVGACAAFPAA